MSEAIPKHLGKKSELPDSPYFAELDRFSNPACDSGLYTARFTCPEFTSICPFTGQPDFAHVIIDYVPKEWIIESKSLKLYLGSFRNHGAFHEACTMMIYEKLDDFLRPHWLRVVAHWYPRGGIPIDVFRQSGNPPNGVYVPDVELPLYRGR